MVTDGSWIFLWWPFHNAYKYQITYVVHLKLIQYYVSIAVLLKKNRAWQNKATLAAKKSLTVWARIHVFIAHLAIHSFNKSSKQSATLLLPLCSREHWWTGRTRYLLSGFYNFSVKTMRLSFGEFWEFCPSLLQYTDGEPHMCKLCAGSWGKAVGEDREKAESWVSEAWPLHSCCLFASISLLCCPLMLGSSLNLMGP